MHSFILVSLISILVALSSRPSSSGTFTSALSINTNYLNLDQTVTHPIGRSSKFTIAMKLITLAPALALLTPVLGMNIDINAVKCQQTHPNIFKAIDELCSKTDLVVPSDYAYKGKWVNGKQAKITGNCGNMSPVWVPQYWCRNQFWSVCANSNSVGRGLGIFGEHKCQVFWTL